MIDSVQKQREEEAAAEVDDDVLQQLQRGAAERVEQKKSNSKVVTMEEVNREREIMARKGGQGLLVKSWAVKAQESFASSGLGLEMEKLYSDTELVFKKISEHPLSGQEVSNVHEIQAEIKKTALRRSGLRESEWRALRLDDLIPVMDAEPTLRRKMVTLYGHELLQSKHNSVVQEELKRRRDDANLNEEKEDQWIMIKKLCGHTNGSSEELTDVARSRLEEELTMKYTQGKLVLPAAIAFYKQFIEGAGGKGSMRKVNPAEHRSTSITSMLSSKVAVQRLPLGVTRADVESFLTQLNVSGLKSCQFDSHGTNAVLDFYMPQFAQECVMRVDAQRMRATDPETLKVSLHEAAKLEPGKILIAERYEKDVPISTVSALFRNIPNFKGTCKPYGASYCFAEFVDATSCASALNKAHATSSEVYFRYVSQSELLEFQSARQKEREEAVRQFQAAENHQRPVQPAPVMPPKQPQSSPAPASSSGSSNHPSAIFFTCSGIPFDISLDNLKRRMSLYSGCLVNTLRNRECAKGDVPSPLRFQELQVQFQHETSAIACLNAMNGRPFMDDRPEYGPVKVGIKTSKNVSPTLPNVTPVPSVPPILSKNSSSTNVSQTNSSNMPVPSSSNMPFPSSQNSAELLIFLVTSNIPMISPDEISRKFMDAPGFLGTKVEIRPDPKAPGSNSVKCLFTDYASAQRCLDSMAGRPFSPHHDIGPVRGYVKQVSKELMMQERQKRKQAQPQQMLPQPSEAAVASQQHVQTLQYVSQQPQMQQQTTQPMQYAIPHVSHPVHSNYTQPAMQPVMQPMMQQNSNPMILQASQPLMQQSPQHMMQQSPQHMMHQTSQPVILQTSQQSHGQLQHMMPAYIGGIPQHTQHLQQQSNPQLMSQHMPPATQSQQYYQQQLPAHMQQQQSTQIAPQQMLLQSHPYPQAQLYQMQQPPMQHIPAQQYSYQPPQPVAQYAQASSPTAAELQRLDDELRENQERMQKLQRMAGQQ
jgi:hypothetical protein